MISVIIPVYNVEEYLPACLDSVLGQTYTDLEVVLVNDGSTDSSPAICEEYAARDSRIKVVHQENQGMSGARNAGLAAATGEYINFLDSDDLLEPDAIEYLYNLCRTHDADLSVCPMLRLERDGSIAPYKNHSAINGTEVFEGRDVMTSYIPLHKQTNTLCGKLYARELFRGLVFPMGKTSEDVFMSYQVLHRVRRAVVDERPVYIYRNRPGSVMKRRISRRDFDVIEGRLLEKKFIEENYPELAAHMPVKLCSAAVTLVLRSAADKFSDPEMDKLVKGVIRENLKAFLHSGQKKSRKMWAVMSVLSLGLTRSCVRLYRRAKHM